MSAHRRWVRAVNKGKTTAGLAQWIYETNYPVTMPRRKFLRMWFGLYWGGFSMGMLVGIIGYGVLFG